MMQHTTKHVSPKDAERILRLRRLMARELLHEHWEHLGIMTGCADVICDYRQLGELHWGDSAYDACVLQVLTVIMDRCPEKLTEVEQFVSSIVADAPGEFTNATLAKR